MGREKESVGSEGRVAATLALREGTDKNSLAAQGVCMAAAGQSQAAPPVSAY